LARIADDTATGSPTGSVDAQTEISKNSEKFKEKFGPRNFPCMKYPAQAAPQHARPAIDF
jgi:hypothetical protein